MRANASTPLASSRSNRALAGLREDGLIMIEKGKIRLLDRTGIELRLAGRQSGKDQADSGMTSTA